MLFSHPVSKHITGRVASMFPSWLRGCASISRFAVFKLISNTILDSSSPSRS